MIQFSESAKNMRSSEIRRLMSLAADPTIISFAGGMPNNSLFPIDAIDEIYSTMPLAEKQVACQYGPTQGYPPLLQSLKSYLASRGLPVDDSQSVLITTGAQQAISLMSKVLIDPQDRIVTEYPSFIGAIAAFKSYGAILKGIDMDGEGISVDGLARALEDRFLKPKMVYLNPVFQNPAGTMYSKKRKQEVLDLLLSHNEVCLLEDDPYSELYFEEKDKDLVVPLKAMASKDAPVCYVGTFAKIFGPGMRLGWLLGPRDIVDKCELAKQSMDACSSTFTQVLADEYFRRGKLAPYLAMLRPTYKRRADIMLSALESLMPAGISWTKPRGGFYVWVTLPETLDSSDVFSAAIKQGAAFVIGNAFDPEEKRNNCFRLAFSHTPEDKIEQGVRTIAQAVKQLLF
jgi:DNA-binding transcriptional MocR family regulator